MLQSMQVSKEYTIQVTCTNTNPFNVVTEYNRAYADLKRRLKGTLAGAAAECGCDILMLKQAVSPLFYCVDTSTTVNV